MARLCRLEVGYEHTFLGLSKRKPNFLNLFVSDLYSQNPGTELEDSYLTFFNSNLKELRVHLNDEKVKRQVIKVRFGNLE